MTTLVLATADLKPFRVIPLEGRECLTIGRATHRDLIANDSAISRFHGVLYREAGEWCIADAGSASGTRVDGERVKWKRLKPGRIAALGGLRLWIVPGHGDLGCPPPAIADRFEPAIPVPAVVDPCGATSAFLDADGDFLSIPLDGSPTSQ